MDGSFGFAVARSLSNAIGCGLFIIGILLLIVVVLAGLLVWRW